MLFEFPGPGTYAVGVVTNENPGKLRDAVGEECVIVYLPNAPNPPSGRVFVVPRRRLTPLDMSVEDAVSMFVSSGAVVEGGIGSEESEARAGKSRRFGEGRGRTARCGGAARRERGEGE